MPDALPEFQPITTERLLLLPMTIDDLDVIATMQMDPAVMEHYGNGKPLSRTEAEVTVLTYHVHCRDHGYWAGL